MALDFSGALTDRLVTTSTSTPKSVSFWSYQKSSGATEFGRLFDKNTGSGTTFSLYDRDTSTIWYFDRAAATTTGQWTIVQPTKLQWNHIVLTYDPSTPTTPPIIYVNGTSVTVTTIASPAGALTTNSDAMVIGNREPTASRNFNGYICEFATYDSILTQADVDLLSAKINPLMVKPGNLLMYDRIGAESGDYFNANGTITTATVVDSISIYSLPTINQVYPGVIGGIGAGGPGHHIRLINDGLVNGGLINNGMVA